MHIEFQEFKPDVRCTIFENCSTFEGYCKVMVPHFHLTENVPEPIKRRLQIIRQLIIHAYFEYEFWDVAYERTFQTLELALHMKYKEFYPNKNGLKNLNPYLDWAKRNNLINEEQKNALSFIRNHITHQKMDQISGITSLKMINTIGNDLINSIFNLKLSQK